MADLAFKFLRGAEGNLPVNGTDGHLYLTEDKHRLYASVAGKVVPVGQGVIKVSNFDALTSVTGAIAGEFYLCETENLLVIYNGKEFVPVAVDTGMTSVEVVGEGNAVTAANYDPATRKLTLTKGETFATKAELEAGVQEAKDYADGLIEALPEQTDYTVTITETVDGLDTGIAKKYTFTQNGAEIGSINLAKELVVTAGSVKEVTEANVPYADAKVGEKYIELVIANQDAPIYVPAKDLVDIYTAKDGATEVQVAISNTNEISATLVNGGITEEKLAEGVKTKLNKVWEEIGVAAGLVATEKGEREAADAELAEAIEAAKTDAANKDVVVLSEAQKYADAGLADKVDKVDGYSLVSDAEIERLSNVDNYDDTEVRGLIGDNTQAIGDEAARADAAEKALAGRLDTLEAMDHDFASADAALKAELEGKIAEGDAATLEAAKKEASDQAAVVLAEAEKYAASLIAEAITWGTF